MNNDIIYINSIGFWLYKSSLNSKWKTPNGLRTHMLNNEYSAGINLNNNKVK